MRVDQPGLNCGKTLPSFDLACELRQTGDQTGLLPFEKTEAIVFCIHTFSRCQSINLCSTLEDKDWNICGITPGQGHHIFCTDSISVMQQNSSMN